MTGFGSGAASDPNRSVKVEARSVNHRYGDIVPRLPKGFYSIEERVRQLAKEYVQRGRVEIFVSIEEFRGKERTVRLDQGLLEGYTKAVSEAGKHLQQDGAVTVDMLLHLPEVFVVEETEVDAAAVWPLIAAAVRAAFDHLAAMRNAEGLRLESDIVHRLASVEQIIEEMGARAPDIVDAYRSRLAERICQLLDDAAVDERRLAGEVALFADKSNIDEELTRARSHIAQFRQACAETGSVGRKLDFLVQEMSREVNTIGSKAGDVEIAQLVVDAKAELEKIREQVQNIE